MNLEEGGVCYRLYPHSLFDEKINENINAEMARQPLLVCLKNVVLRKMKDIEFFRKISCKRNYLLGQVARLQNLC